MTGFCRRLSDPFVELAEDAYSGMAAFGSGVGSLVGQMGDSYFFGAVDAPYPGSPWRIIVFMGGDLGAATAACAQAVKEAHKAHLSAFTATLHYVMGP